MTAFTLFFIALVASFIGFAILIPLALAICKLCGLFTIVNEGRCKVYVLFGKVIGTLNEPGLVFLPAKLGAPMGIGVWYEMSICDPVAYLFKNADPRGSLAANVSNSTVRCLSNLPLDQMLEDRHSMSTTVRTEVSPKSNEWGYTLGSVYIRKVHFRDENMIKQIEEKVVNRLRQVTAAIKQAGANQVNIITSTAERTAAVAFAKAAAMRPRIVGEALQEISKDKTVSDALFNVLEVQNILDSSARITLIPKNNELLSSLIAEKSVPESK
jgi:regulator of protease activity HflC (stomatin/prohibitin superfamily)